MLIYFPSNERFSFNTWPIVLETVAKSIVCACSNKIADATISEETSCNYPQSTKEISSPRFIFYRYGKKGTFSVKDFFKMWANLQVVVHLFIFTNEIFKTETSLLVPFLWHICDILDNFAKCIGGNADLARTPANI